MSKALLLLNALAFLGTAAWVLVDHARAATVLGFEVLSGAGTQEFLANFVGLYAALGLALGWTALSSGTRAARYGLTLLFVAGAGLAGGRVIGLLLGVEGAPAQWGYLAWEAVSAILALGLLRKQRRA